MNPSTCCYVRKYIFDRAPGAVITARECMNFGNSSAVYKCLSRETLDGCLVRVAWGAYYKPDPSRPEHRPSLDEIVRAKNRAFARKTISHECQLLDALMETPVPGGPGFSNADLEGICCHGSFGALVPPNEDERSASNETTRAESSMLAGNEMENEHECVSLEVSMESEILDSDDVESIIACVFATKERVSIPASSDGLLREDTDVQGIESVTVYVSSTQEAFSSNSLHTNSELSSRANVLHLTAGGAVAPSACTNSAGANGACANSARKKRTNGAPEGPIDSLVDAVKTCGTKASRQKMNRRVAKDAIYDTDGSTSSFNTIHGRVYLHRVGARKMQLGDTVEGKALRALWCVGASNINDTLVFRGMISLGRKEKRELRARLWLTPNWLKDEFITDIWKYVEPAA